MKTLLAIGRLIRLPLLFVSLADASVVALLISRGRVDWSVLNALWVATTGLYLLAVALNDLVDTRRDRAAAKAGSAGRINPVAAGDLSAAVALGVAVFGGLIAMAAAMGSVFVNPIATGAAGGMILLYNFALKRVPAIGIPLLGGIRAAVASQALVGADAMNWWAVPAIIAAHTIVVSAFAYAWEGRKPSLYGNNWFHMLVVCAAALAVLGMAPTKWGATLWPVGVSLAKVYLTWAIFIAIFAAIFARTPRKQRGRLLRFFGLVWLIPVDYAFLLAAGQPSAGYVFLALLICVVASVHLMRMLGRRAAPRVF